MKDLKNNIYLLVFCLLTVIMIFMTIGSLKAQNTFTADNNFNAPTGPNMFTTIQAAVNAATPGDIVQVQPSPNTYGNVSIDRQIHLMGIGFNVDKDIPLNSQMGEIVLTNNADNTSDASGTIIEGLSFSIFRVAKNTGTSFLLQNVTIRNCSYSLLYTTNAGYSPIDGIDIVDCYISSGSSGYGIFFYMPTVNVSIRNNLIIQDVVFFNTTAGDIGSSINNNILYGGIRVDANSTNVLIYNNNFIGATGSESAFTSKLVDCTVENNIFYGSTPSIAVSGSSSADFQNNTFSNNLVFSTGDDTMPPTGGGSGNIDGGGNLTGSPNFVFSQLLNTWSSSYDFTLQAGSPAITAGKDGLDIGITGNVLFFWMDGNLVLNTTAVPIIESFNTSSVINQVDNLSTTIIINSN